MRGYIGLRDYDYSVNFLTIEILHFGVDFIHLFEFSVFRFTVWLSVDIENEKWANFIEKFVD